MENENEFKMEGQTMKLWEIMKGMEEGRFRAGQKFMVDHHRKYLFVQISSYGEILWDDSVEIELDRETMGCTFTVPFSLSTAQMLDQIQEGQSAEYAEPSNPQQRLGFAQMHDGGVYWNNDKSDPLCMNQETMTLLWRFM